MKSGLPWQVSGVRTEARDTAREAARRAGMSVGEWLDSVILESTQGGEPEPLRRRARDRDPQADERRHDYGRRSNDEREWSHEEREPLRESGPPGNHADPVEHEEYAESVA